MLPRSLREDAQARGFRGRRQHFMTRKRFLTACAIVVCAVTFPGTISGQEQEEEEPPRVVLNVHTATPEEIAKAVHLWSAWNDYDFMAYMRQVDQFLQAYKAGARTDERYCLCAREFLPSWEADRVCREAGIVSPKNHDHESER